jgi:hypothetical protein
MTLLRTIDGYQLPQPLCQPLPQPLCQPLPQPPLCQPLPQPPLCQPLPQPPPLCQCQPPFPQPKPLRHQTLTILGLPAGPVAASPTTADTAVRIAWRRADVVFSDVVFGAPSWLPTSACAGVEANVAEIPKAPAGSSVRRSLRMRFEFMCIPGTKHVIVVETAHNRDSLVCGCRFTKKTDVADNVNIVGSGANLRHGRATSVRASRFQADSTAVQMAGAACP